MVPLVEKRREGSGPRVPVSAAFLLAQVGAQAAARFAERLREIDLAPPHAGLLRAMAMNPGSSQQQLAGILRMVPSRLVPLLDDLEGRGLVERRDHPEDRRLYALHLTYKGAATMQEIARVARAHDDAVCAALTAGERELLATLLARLADAEGLTPGVHPGFARMGPDKDARPSGGGLREQTAPKTGPGRGKSGRR